MYSKIALIVFIKDKTCFLWFFGIICQSLLINRNFMNVISGFKFIRKGIRMNEVNADNILQICGAYFLISSKAAYGLYVYLFISLFVFLYIPASICHHHGRPDM